MGDSSTMRRATVAIVLTAAVLQTGGCRGRAAVPASRLFETAGRFSYVTPDGWTRHRVAGVKYQIVAGQEEDGAAPNLYVTDEGSPQDLDAYVPAFVARQKKIYPDIVVGTERELLTEEGHVARVVEATRSARGTRLVLRFFFLRRAQQTVIITCTWQDAGRPELADVFESAVRTFRFEE